MSDYRVAYRYAKSLVDLAEEQGILERIYEDLALLKKVTEQNRDLRLMLKNPLIEHRKKVSILQKIFSGKIHQLTVSFIDIIGRKGRESILPEIARVFVELYQELKGIVNATITTNFKLDDRLRAEFTAIVKEKVGATRVDLNEKVDPDLIGGYILRIGDLQIDDSLDSKLNALKLQLTSKEHI